MLVLAKFSFLEEDWTLGYNSMKFWHYSELSWFRTFLSLKSFNNSWHTPVYYYFFTCGERKIWWNIKNSHNIMTMFVEPDLFLFFKKVVYRVKASGQYLIFNILWLISTWTCNKNKLYITFQTVYNISNCI